MFDLKLTGLKEGGDLEYKGKDLSVITGFQNMPFLCLFGANLEADTTEIFEGEQRFDWWGNRLFFEQSPEVQYNSRTERLLNNISLTSINRSRIEDTIRKDLITINQFAEVNVQVSITSTDRIEILITIREPNNLDSNEFVYIWDSTKRELEQL